MNAETMTLEILLPFRVFARKEAVLRIVAETPEGSWGLLPNRLDCISPLTPGILTYETAAEREAWVAVDEGILIKTGPIVVVSVRHATGGVDLGSLRATVEQEFKNLDERERNVRSALAKLEGNFIRRYAELHHG